MSDTYTISKEVINNLFLRIVNTEACIKPTNGEHVKQILLNELSDSAIESIVHLQMIDKEYKSIEVGSHVLCKPPSYHVGSEFEWDILQDLGLKPKVDGYVYGRVIGDTSWSSGKPFNQFYGRIKVNLLYHDDKKKLKEYEHEVNGLSLILIEDDSIPFLSKSVEIPEITLNI